MFLVLQLVLLTISILSRKPLKPISFHLETTYFRICFEFMLTCCLLSKINIQLHSHIVPRTRRGCIMITLSWAPLLLTVSHALLVAADVGSWLGLNNFPIPAHAHTDSHPVSFITDLFAHYLFFCAVVQIKNPLMKQLSSWKHGSFYRSLHKLLS